MDIFRVLHERVQTNKRPDNKEHLKVDIGFLAKKWTSFKRSTTTDSILLWIIRSMVPWSFVSCTYKDESCEDVQTPVKFMVKKGKKSKVQSLDQEIKIGNQEAKISSNEEDVRFPGKVNEMSCSSLLDGFFFKKDRQKWSYRHDLVDDKDGDDENEVVDGEE
ncbi:hypothetical protein Q3G72_015837 [Acer saccharum]|nr:hypothetical protein Q3G72_015837 [Acer saccharum]